MKKMADIEISKELANEIFEVVELSKKSGKLKVGANEVTKILEKGNAKLVCVATDVNPPEIVMHLPFLCKEKNVPFAKVGTKAELGAACGIDVTTSSIVIIDAGEAKNQLASVSKKLKILLGESTESETEEVKEEKKEKTTEKKTEEKPKEEDKKEDSKKE
jgi:large subunit ribosomal protein L7Ae